MIHPLALAYLQFSTSFESSTPSGPPNTFRLLQYWI